MRILYPHYFGLFFNRTDFIVSPQTNHESYTVYCKGLGPDGSKETQIYLQKKSDDSDYRSLFNCLTMPCSSYHSAPTLSLLSFTFMLDASWLQDELLPSGHHVFYSRKERRNKGKLPSMPDPFYQESHNFLKMTIRDFLLHTSYWTEWSHMMTSFAFWILMRLGQVRDVSKALRGWVERGQGISSLFFPLSIFSTAFLAYPPITTAPAGHTPPWL